MLPDIHRATQKFYIFLIVYLTGCTPKHADEALYTTKRNGRDGFRIYHEVEEKEV